MYIPFCVRLATQAQCARGLRLPIAQPHFRFAVIVCLGMLFTPHTHPPTLVDPQRAQEVLGGLVAPGEPGGHQLVGATIEGVEEPEAGAPAVGAWGLMNETAEEETVSRAGRTRGVGLGLGRRQVIPTRTHTHLASERPGQVLVTTHTGLPCPLFGQRAQFQCSSRDF